MDKTKWIVFSSSDGLIEATLNLQIEEEHEDGAMNVDNPRLSEGVSKVLSTALQRVLTEDKRTDNCDNAPKEGLQNPVQSEQAKGNETPVNISLEEENRILKEARMCKICMDAEVGIVFLPCGHLTTCITCATNLQYCPLCRSTIKATVRTFLS